MLIPLIGGSYQAPSLNAETQRSINLYPELIESGQGKNKASFYGAPGIHTFTTLPKSPIRGLWPGDNRLFAVAGDTLYEVYSDATSASRGSVSDDAQHSPAQVFPNGNQLFIVSANQGYCDNGAGPVAIAVDNSKSGTVTTGVSKYPVGHPELANGVVSWVSGDQFDPSMEGESITINGSVYTVMTVQSSTTLLTTVSTGTQATPVNYTGTYTMTLAARTGAFLDGYFIAALPDSKRIRISKLWDGTSWDPMDFGTKEGYPDNIAAILADHQELWLCGFETTEPWSDTGNSDFPFQRESSGVIRVGLAAPYSLAQLGESFYGIGGDRKGLAAAFRVRGFAPQRISTHAVEQVWNSYSTIADAEAYGYIDRGHAFYEVSFPTADATWCYDETTGLWHERGYYSGGVLHRVRARCHAYVGLAAHGASPALQPRHYVGDYQSGKIYVMSSDYYDDDGAAKYYQRDFPHICEEQVRQFHYALQIDMETGVSIGSEESLYLSWSNDNGHTFNAPRAAGIGTAGENAKRVLWRRLGMARDRVYRVTYTGKAKVAWINAYLRAELGIS